MIRDSGSPPDLGLRAAYEYELPEDRIARYPTERRDGSRLLVVRRGGFDTLDAPDGLPAPESSEAAGAVGEVEPHPPIAHEGFDALPSILRPGDLLVLNESRVLPLRLLGRKATGAGGEVLLLHPTDPEESFEGARAWEAFVRPGGKLRPGHTLEISEGLRVHIVARREDGTRCVRLESALPTGEALRRWGRLPLPPYLDREEEPLDQERYQTVYATVPGSVAAPTAGLHFTPELLDRLRSVGVGIATVTLHVGPGTFRPVESERVEDHRMHAEWWELPVATAEAIRRTRERGGRVWAVGTTVVRTLESAVGSEGEVAPGSGSTNLFLTPGSRFRVVDGLLTNFHLPGSTLLMLVAAFAGYQTTMESYRVAIREGYRFYSYGDAMLILPHDQRGGG